MIQSAPERREVGGTAGLLLRIADILDYAVEKICSLVLIVSGLVMLGVLTVNVFARYLFASGGLISARELPERLYPVFIIAGIVLAVVRGGHLSVDTLLLALGRNGQRILLLIVAATVIVAYAVLCQQSLFVASITDVDRSPVLGIPTSYGYYALAAGCIGVMLTSMTIAVRVAILGPDSRPMMHSEDVHL
jgi:TRAP-type transport system small permease protein